jgi:hypothetical protein
VRSDTFDLTREPIIQRVAFPYFWETVGVGIPSANPYQGEYQAQLFAESSDLPLASCNFDLTFQSIPVLPRRVVFVLDRGRTMGTAVPPYAPRCDRLRAGASRAISVLNDDDELGVALFDSAGVVDIPIGPLSDVRLTAEELCSVSPPNDKLKPGTSFVKAIQAGIDAGRGIDPADPNLRVIVMTDGATTAPPRLPNEEGNQASGTFAVALMENLTASVARTFRKIKSADGSYVHPPPDAGEFIFEKHLTQILLDIAGTDVLIDPLVTLKPKQRMHFPLPITEADQELQIIVFSDKPEALAVRLAGKPRVPSPDVDFAAAAAARQVKEEPVPLDDWLDVPFPSLLTQGRGALVRRVRAIDPKAFDEFENIGVSLEHVRDAIPGSSDPSARICLIVAGRTDIRLDARVESSGLEVGAELLFSAVILEYGNPPRNGASVEVELRHPDGGIEIVPLTSPPGTPGRFEGTRRAFRSGVYQAHFVARGTTLIRKRAFRREALRTAVITAAGSAANECCPPEERPEGQDPCDPVVRLRECLRALWCRARQSSRG